MLDINGTENIKTKKGKTIEKEDEAKYLGCVINDKGNPQREINKRIADTYHTWKKLELLWKKTDPPIKFKIRVYSTIIKQNYYNPFAPRK